MAYRPVGVISKSGLTGLVDMLMCRSKRRMSAGSGLLMARCCPRFAGVGGVDQKPWRSEGVQCASRG